MKRNRGLALLLALCLLAGMAVLPVAAQDEPGTLPVCLPGDVMDDEMGYADINGVPWGTGWKTSRVTAPAEWTGEIWPDSTEPKVGGVEVKDGNIRISRTGEITDSNTAAVTRVLSSQTQPDDNMTLEFEYEKEETAKLYMSISAATNWRGPLALVHNPNGSFSSAGQGGGTLNNINATGTVKVTMHLHILREDPEEADKETGGYATIYINDQLLVENYQYDPRYVGYYEPGNIGFTLQKGTEMNQGVTIHYVRYTETEQYAEIAMAKDAQSIDCQGLPQSGSAITESLTLPEIPENLPYGSAAVWNSSDDNILNAQTGEVVRGERDQTVTLSLNMSKLDENGEIATETTPTVSFQYTVTGTAAESDVPGTLPVRLPGDVMDDEMGYADINDVPWGYWKNGYPGGIADQTEGKPLPYLHMYVTGAVAQPADFSGEAWYDDENRSSKDGAIEVVNGNLKLTRTAAQNTGQTVSLAKFLALDAQTVDKMTIELEYEKDPGAKLQIGLQAWNNWKGAFAFTHNEEGAFEGVNGSTGITSTGITKMTLHLDKAEKTVDIYINDRLLKKGMAYDSRYLDFCDAGKIGFNLLNAGEPNKGVTIHAIRYMETAQYANIALAKDKAALDADALLESLPADQSVLEEDLTMPNLNALPYGSAPYLESSDSGILNAETGEIMQRPVDQSVTLKLKLKKQNENGEYTVLEDVLAQRSYTVAKTQATLQDDVDALTVEDLLGKNAAADQIKTALTLPSLGELAACDITWSADPADGPVDPATGEVTRPQYGDDVPVILTATFQDASGVTATKTFTVTVLVMPTFGENLALGKQVTTSSTYSAAYGGDQAVDGDRTTTRWASKGSNQWIQIDMGTPTKVSALRFYEFAQRISSFVVEYSQDGSSWETASTVTGLPSGATTNRAAYTTEFTPVTAQYFRLRQTAGANDITIFEVELYDTTVRLYESAVSSNDETLGSVSQQGGPGYALGTEVALTAEPAITGKFVQWQLPEGLELTEGTKDTAEIRYLQPKKNLKIVAEFIEKTTASLDVQSAAYDKYESNENHKDIVVHLNPGDYVLQNVLCGTQTLEEGTHYTKEGNTITLLKSWMDTLSGEQTVVFQMDGGEQPALKLTVQDSDPQLLLQADLDAVATPDYQLQSGMTIPAVGPVNGSAITVTSSNTSVVQIVQETQGDQIVHKIVVVTPRSSTNVTLTITASLQEQTKSKSSRHAVAGSGISGGSGGSSGSGGGGGSSVSRPSSPGVIDYGNGTADNTPAQPVPEENQPGSFADVSRDSWASEYVELLVEKGVVAGDELGNYQPDRAVTREEFVKMVVAALGLQSSGTAQLPFTDVAVNDWSYPYIAAAYEAGIISGTSDTTFGVGETMSRQDIAVVTARALDAAQVEALPVTESIQFTDAADAADYAAQSIDQIARFGIVGGYPDGSFRPLDTITRAEAAKVLAQIIRLKEE